MNKFIMLLAKALSLVDNLLDTVLVQKLINEVNISSQLEMNMGHEKKSYQSLKE